MTLLLICAIAFSVFIVWMVTSPLFSAENMELFAASYRGFTDEAELRQVLQLRDKLLARLVQGKSEDERIGQLAEEECFQALISLSLRLQRAELPYLPQSSRSAAQASSSASGFASISLLLVIASLFLGGVFACKSKLALAQEAPASNAPAMAQPQSAPAAPPSAPVADASPLHLLEPGVYAPQSNRYMISPAQGFISAHHLTFFSVPTTITGGLTVVLPLPEKLYDWQILSLRPESLNKHINVVNWHGIPALQIPAGTQGLVVELSSEFKLNAFSGRVSWQNSKLTDLPGEQVVVLFMSSGILQKILGTTAESWNMWPPRFTAVAENLRVQNREIAMDPSKPPREVQVLQRKSPDKQPFLQFELLGVAPNRLPLMVLASLVGAILFGIALFVFFRGSRWRIDRPESLPG